MSTEPTPSAATHYFCERCGGTGQQEEGVWNPDQNKYNDPAGLCRACRGSGLLGPIYRQAQLEEEARELLAKFKP